VHTAQDTTVTFNFHVGADETGSADTIAAVISGMDAKSLSVKGALNPSVLLGTAPATGTLALSTATASAPTLTVGGSPANNDVFRFSLEGQAFAITANIGAGGDKYEDSVTGVAAQIKDAINDAKIAGVTATSAAGVVTISKSGAISLASNTAAQTAIGLIDTAITDVNAQRAKLGAISNRLDSTVKNLTNIVTNLEAGRGRVEDADFAAETTNLAKSQILQQASMAMLAQANASKQGVLSLLQR
jgi:flagellin